jgi:hypothetical protein
MARVTTSSDDFVPRHLDINEAKTEAMLSTVGASSMTDLTDKVVPENIRLNRRLDMEGPIGTCLPFSVSVRLRFSSLPTTPARPNI